MYGPDIDLLVLTDRPEETSLNVLNDFIRERNFRKYELGDFVKFPLEGRPKGFIVVLINEYKSRRWEIEIWFKKSLSDDDVYYSKILSAFSEEQRLAILALKHQRELRHISKNKLNSTTIYKGVILEGKTRIEDFGI